MRSAIVSAKHGLFPIGGVVDGVNQMKAHQHSRNGLAGGEQVAVSEPKEVVATIYGEALKDKKVIAVTVQGKRGWFLESGFKFT